MRTIHGGKSTRNDWFAWSIYWEDVQRRRLLLSKYGMLSRLGEPWADVLANKLWPKDRYSKRNGFHRLAERFAKAVKEDSSLGEALDATWRMGGNPKSCWQLIIATVQPEKKLTDEEKLEARKAGAQRALERRVKHAQEMLAKHQAKLAIEERLVAKWGRVVRRYEREGRL